MSIDHEDITNQDAATRRAAVWGLLRNEAIFPQSRYSAEQCGADWLGRSVRGTLDDKQSRAVLHDVAEALRENDTRLLAGALRFCLMNRWLVVGDGLRGLMARMSDAMRAAPYPYSDDLGDLGEAVAVAVLQHGMEDLGADLQARFRSDVTHRRASRSRLGWMASLDPDWMVAQLPHLGGGDPALVSACIASLASWAEKAQLVADLKDQLSEQVLRGALVEVLHDEGDVERVWSGDDLLGLGARRGDGH